MALFGGLGRAASALMPLPAGQDFPPVAAPRRGLFGGRANMSLPEFIMLAGATAKDISGGGSSNFGNTFGFIQDRREKAANAPFEEAKRQLAMEAMRRQMAAYGIADQSQLTPQEQIALAFNPGALGDAFASGSERATLGRNDRSIFRGQEVIRNDAPADPQVVGPGASLVNDQGVPIFRAPQFEAVPESSRLVQTDPGTMGAPAPTDEPINLGERIAMLTDLGARVTSGFRTPEHNARVGGVPNSFHTRGTPDNPQAYDLVPPKGMTMAQLAEEAKRALPGFDVINEGDHVHIEPGSRAAAPTGGQPRVVVGAAPKRQEWVTLPAEQTAQFGPGSYQTNVETGEIRQIPGSAPKGGGRATAAVLALQDDHLDALQIATGVQANLQKFEQQITRGELNLGPMTNLISQGRNVVGASDQNSRNFASFRANLEKLRNDSLRLNKGVQTEGDAVRAWNELLANINDEKVVLQRLREINELNQRAVVFRQAMVEQIREDAGLPPLDPSKFMVQRPAAGGQRTPPPQRGAAPQAPPAAQRKANQVYQTPKGPLRWTGTGWVKP